MNEDLKYNILTSLILLALAFLLIFVILFIADYTQPLESTACEVNTACAVNTTEKVDLYYNLSEYEQGNKTIYLKEGGNFIRA